ncbi:MAG: M28 family peptidase [Acidobacteria bacterium]|nr:M28 family peptidase [Acidobacteriota bacterium]
MSGFVWLICAGLWMQEGEARFLDQVRQLTFEGKRAGEGYFGRDGSLLVFQSEREAGNPFYQIYLTDLETGDVQRISTGVGKTTCAWIHPQDDRVLFASTHADPNAKLKMAEEIALRESGKQRRYAWDYDETFDLWSADFKGDKLIQITDALGYDAEASWSPDGSKIVFASNRIAYQKPMSPSDQAKFELDKAFMIDLFLMDVATGAITQLTDMPGYDGGPFFNTDGSKICWRHFSEDGATAEIWIMDADGSNPHAITKLGAMSWAPYFHPSGEYLIFTTNVHGFSNFELYLVSPKGGTPVRITTTDGFDGLPVFTPDGNRLAWTSNRTANGTSQIFMANWNHEAAVKSLQPTESNPEIDSAELMHHIQILASDDMAGRPTGETGERLAAEYIAGVFQDIGLKPQGSSYFQPFEFKAGVSLGPNNTLQTPETSWVIDEAWRPLSFSSPGLVSNKRVVFAGYGIVAPETEHDPSYDSYVHLDVKDAWVMVLRYAPENVDEAVKRHLNRYASLRYKAMVARDKGAAGLIVVSGPLSGVEHQLVALKNDATISGTSIAAISISDEVALELLKPSGKSLETLQKELDSGDVMMGVDLGVQLTANVDLVHEKKTGTNIIGILPANQSPTLPALAIGAHFDHLGTGEGGSSLARGDEKGMIHYGADDNASGVSGMLEIAQYLIDQRAKGKLDSARDLYIMAWSGEEMGLLGSNHFVSVYETEDLSQTFAAYLNLDMIGRLDKSLVVQGLGSSSVWPGLIERANVPVGLSIQTSNDSYLPTDATSFYLKKVPILSAFTGAHEDYHTPRDRPEKINIEGCYQITKFVALLARQLMLSETQPDYVAMEKPANTGEGRGIRVYLGTIPDYAQGDLKGVRLSGVSKGGPAESAGVLGGDVIVSLAGKKIENIYDYTYAMDTLKVGEPAEMVVMRNGESVQLTVVPGTRD